MLALASEGLRFQADIARLIERGGFKNVKNRSSKKGPGIIADLEGNKVLFQCKKAEKHGKQFVGIEALRDQYRTIVGD